MTQDETIIGKAGDIITRFGGIRPMSTKTGIPVTTIQGWKQRDAIPAIRRNELIDAANRNGINLGDLLIEIAGQKTELSTREQQDHKAAEDIKTAQLDPDLHPGNHQATWIAAGALVLAAGILGVIMAFAPKVNSINQQDVRIHELEQQLQAMRQAQDSTDAEDVKQKLLALENKVGTLSEQAQSYAGVVNDLKSGSITDRLGKIETHVGGLLKNANSLGLQNLVNRIQAMKSTPEGEGQVSSLLSTLVAATETSTPETMTEAFALLKSTDPHVAETFKDVAPEDMKAAVMLLGMSQLRSSLARDNTSFESDLKILKATMAKDNPELAAAIDRLAPNAKSGVLTPNGLSGQLRGLTGEIVAASLTGQEVSVEERAKARFGNVLKVEKNGQQVSGTSTQITIAEAQKRLDAGDVNGAVSLLQQIQGPAAEKTKPLISAAQATLLASQVQNLVGQNIVRTLKGMAGKSVPYTTGGGGTSQIIDQIKTMGAGIASEVGQ